MVKKPVLSALVVMAVIVVTGAVTAWVTWWDMLNQISSPYSGMNSGPVLLRIQPGTSTSEIAARLVEADIVTSDWVFRFAVWRSGRDRELQAGEYLFEAPLSPLDVVAKIADGRVHLRRITFPEGLTLSEMSTIFESEGFGVSGSFINASQQVDLVSDLDSAATNLEGYLFPETYALPSDATANDLVRVMVEQFRAVFGERLRGRARDRNLSIRQVVTLASIIEKETGEGGERSLVSAVFNNRLRIGMPLQSDPTVIYALEVAGLYDGNLTRENLQYDSPYNTYRYREIPPGPIASPGAAALRASLEPADASYLYFVSRNDGTHAFADTLREHNRNVREFQIEYFRRQRARE